MDQKIKNILDDLYRVDASLKKHETEIIKIINEYMQAKPATKFDEKFALKLRQVILERITGVKTKKERARPSALFPSGFDWLNRFAYVLGGMAIGLAIILPLVTVINKSNKNLAKSLNAPLISGGVKKLNQEAFGKISLNSSDSAALDSTTRGGSSGAVAAAQGLGGGSSESAKMMAPGVGGGLMPPRPVNYQYVYKGAEFTQDQSSLDVYKRVKGEFGSKGIAQYITGLNYDLINLAKFRTADTNLGNLTLTEDREFGYVVSLDMLNNTISVYANWNKWPRPDKDCSDEACFNSFRLKYEDIQSDDKIIAIANNFLKDYGVKMDNYGEPQVQNYWRQEYERAPDKTLVYIPDEMTVIYPLLINGEPVYDESGNPTGLTVGVNIRYNKGASISQIIPQNFVSSAYTAETDVSKILELAKKGGLYGEYQTDNSGEAVEIDLDTPKQVLMRYYAYDLNTGESNELYAPALIFPIANATSTTLYYRQNIIVPLVQEIINDLGGPVDILKSGASSPGSRAAGAETAEPVKDEVK